MAVQSNAHPLAGARVWLVTDGTAESAAWQEPWTDALRAAGAASVDALSVSGVLGWTARGLLEQGAEKVARTLRLARRGEPDASAFDALAKANPDLLIADHPGTFRTLEVIRDTMRGQALHVGLLTPPCELEAWRGARADAFIAADAPAIDAVRRPGMSDVALQVAGPPIPRGFEPRTDRDERRTRFGFGADDRVVLIDVDGTDAADVDRWMFQASLYADGIIPLFYYGRDHHAADVLRQSAAVHGLSARMFGHVDDLGAYAIVADLVVTGPNCTRVASYLALDRPVVSFDPRLDDTAWVREGAVARVVDAAGLGSVLARVAGEGVPESHAQAANRAVGPSPTEDVVAALGRIWEARSHLREAIVPMHAKAAPSAASADRFEAIGATQDPSSAPLSRAAAKEQLAALILDERRVEAELAEKVKARDRWMGRLRLAESHGENDLVAVASGRVEAVGAEVRGLGERLDAIRLEKDRVRRRALARPAEPATPAAPADAPDVESRFRALEMRDDLDRLRRRAKEE